MTIRARLTYWYAAMLLTSMLILAGGLYYELVLEPVWVEQAKQPKEPMEEEIAEIIFYYGVPTAVLSVIGGWWLLKKALAPLDRLALAAEGLHVRNLHEPLPRTGNGDEVDRLTQALNDTNGRLEESFNRIQEFTLHASHELKTPLAILRGEIEISLNEADTTAQQREAFASQLDEIHRLTQIVEGLTLLAKADAGKVVLANEPLRLDELVRENLADAQILAQPKKVTVNLGNCDEVMVRGDRHRLRQLLLNLTDNSLKYNEPGGRVEMSLVRKGSDGELTIANTGRGIPPQILDRVFDRFFRGDESHSSDIDGCGLGLSIAQWIVKAHHGEIELSSIPGGLTTVKVRLAQAS